MTRYYILVKSKKDKTWRGAIPVKQGVSLATVKSAVRKNLKKGAVARIVTAKQLGVSGRKRRARKSIRRKPLRRFGRRRKRR